MRKIITYEFIGSGTGVPGLPHVISDLEAERLGVTIRLQGAIEAGTYIVRGEASQPEQADAPKKAKAAEPTPTQSDPQGTDDKEA